MKFILLALSILIHPLIAADLIPRGATWRFVDNGRSPSPDWTTTTFSDATWKTGPAPLGYGDPDTLKTTVSFGTNPKAKRITTWFRHQFQVSDLSTIPGLLLELRRDDGAVVYLNGTEVVRSAMPKGKISPITYALASASNKNEESYYKFSIPSNQLVAGTNVIAVEIHQVSARSSDIAFDLSLEVDSGSVTRGPYLQLPTDSSIIIRWRTTVPMIGTVRYGKSPDELIRSASESEPTTEHAVTLSDLPPSSTWTYSIGTPTSTMAGGDSDFTFTTSPTPGTASDSRIWILGDCGTANRNQLAVRNAFHHFAGKRPADLILLLGDNAYGNGTDAEYQAAIFDMYRRPLRQIPVWSTLGNHDTAQKTNFDGHYPYFDIFNLPAAAEAGGEPSGTEHYYSFNRGNVHFICLDSMTASRSPSGPMATWLKADLASNTATWTIAFWHHPPYTKGSHDSDTEIPLVEMRQNMLPILEDGGIDLVFSGHSHCYERSFLIDGFYGDSSNLAASMVIDKESGDPGKTGAYTKPLIEPRAHAGTVYTVAGSSGKISGGPLNHSAMFTSLNQLGSVAIDVEEKQLKVSFIHPTGKPLGSTYSIPDTFTIQKK